MPERVPRQALQWAVWWESCDETIRSAMNSMRISNGPSRMPHNTNRIARLGCERSTLVSQAVVTQSSSSDYDFTYFDVPQPNPRCRRTMRNAISVAASLALIIGFSGPVMAEGAGDSASTASAQKSADYNPQMHFETVLTLHCEVISVEPASRQLTVKGSNGAQI